MSENQTQDTGNESSTKALPEKRTYKVSEVSAFASCRDDLIKLEGRWPILKEV